MNSVAIIPTLNEEKTIESIIRNTLKHVDTLIIVDSSSDNTPRICKSFRKGVILVTCKRLGKGYATRIGIKRALEFNPKYLVFLDGDGEKDPNCIPKLLKRFEEYDFVVGRRNMMRSRTRHILNRFSNLWFRIATNYDVTDMTSGFFAIRSGCIKKFQLKSMRFEIETEMILEAFRNNLTLTEVPVDVPKISESKLHSGHMIEINEFFDKWVLKNIHIQKSLSKRIFLPVFCILGIMFSYILRPLALKYSK